MLHSVKSYLAVMGEFSINVTENCLIAVDQYDLMKITITRLDKSFEITVSDTPACKSSICGNHAVTVLPKHPQHLAGLAYNHYVNHIPF